MRISDVYHRYEIPPNLQDHMIRVYGVICFIANHWTGDPVDWDLVKKMALLHDIGNIIKFDLAKYPHFLGSELKNINHWQQVRRQFIKKYGSDDHAATQKILTEIGLSEAAIKTILEKSFGQSVMVMNSSDWQLKLLYYADMRTLPDGVGPLTDRLLDIKKRYAKPDLADLISACHKIETQIQSRLSIPVSDITGYSTRVSPEIASTVEI